MNHNLYLSLLFALVSIGGCTIYQIYYWQQCRMADSYLDQQNFDLAESILQSYTCSDAQTKYIELTTQSRNHTFKNLAWKDLTILTLLKHDLNNYYWLLDQGFQIDLIDSMVGQHCFRVDYHGCFQLLEEYSISQLMIPLVDGFFEYYYRWCHPHQMWICHNTFIELIGSERYKSLPQTVQDEIHGKEGSLLI